MYIYIGIKKIFYINNNFNYINALSSIYIIYKLYKFYLAFICSIMFTIINYIR
jgi:hypothetical protein